MAAVKNVRAILSPIMPFARLVGCYTGDRGRDGRSLGWSLWSLLLCLGLGGGFLCRALLPSKGGLYLRLVDAISALQVFSSLAWSLRAGPILARTISSLESLERTLEGRGIHLDFKDANLKLDLALRSLIIVVLSCLKLANSVQIGGCLTLLSTICLSSLELFNLRLLSLLSQTLGRLNTALSYRSLHFVLSVERGLLQASREFRSQTESRLLFRLSTTYILTTMDLYFMVTAFSGTSSGSRTAYLTLTTLYSFYEVLVAVYSLHGFSYQTGVIRISLFGLVLSDDSGRLAMDGRVRAHINMDSTVKFSACGFFPLDGTVIHAILASVANYLTILYQFGQTSSNTAIDSY